MTTKVASYLNDLPDPSPFTDSSSKSKSWTEAQCHGCSKFFDIAKLKRCSKCKRVWYHSQECQILDFKAPRNHKHMCQENLLAIAMDNLYRLPVEEKMDLMAQGRSEKIPNNQFCQTVAKVTCPGLDAFISRARQELELLKDNFVATHTPQAYEYQGNTLSAFVEDNRYGLDVGVETLVAAINLWPAVYTVNSCSGVHSAAWVPTGKQGRGQQYYCEDYIKFISDDRKALNQVSSILETGSLGIKFRVSCCSSTPDTVASKDGFLVLDYKQGSQPPKTCRTYCRVMSWSQEPFDKLDSLLWMMTMNGPPYARMHNNIIGLYGTALELIQANPSLSPSGEQQKKLKSLHLMAEMARKQMIFTFASKAVAIDMPFAEELLQRMEEANWWAPKP